MKILYSMNDITQPIQARLSPIAAITGGDRGVADTLLAEFALRLKRDGWRVHGLVQQGHELGKTHTELVDIVKGERYRLFQELGSASASCSLDSSSVTAASVALRRALDENADLAVANRFGALEAEGKGFAAEMLALMAEGVPLITVVSEDYLLDWRWFTGKAGVELPPIPLVLEDWFAGLAGGRR